MAGVDICHQLVFFGTSQESHLAVHLIQQATPYFGCNGLHGDFLPYGTFKFIQQLWYTQLPRTCTLRSMQEDRICLEACRCSIWQS